MIDEVIPAQGRSMPRPSADRCFPTGRQSRALAERWALTRQFSNAARQERRDAYRKAGKSISDFDQCKALTQIRKEDPTWARSLLHFDATIRNNRSDRRFRD